MKSTSATRRNDPCPCGSGRRFKSCHGSLVEDPRLERAQQLRVAGELDGALATLDAALAETPYFPGALNVKGVILRDRLDLAGAERCFREAIEQSPDYAHAHFNLGIVLLILGRYPEGWRDYAWRTRQPGYADWADFDFGMPRWNGEPLAGKRVLVHAEQGLGDTVQCARFLEPLAREAQEVDLFCHEPLEAVMQRMRGVGRAYGALHDRPTHDYHATLLDVAAHFLPTSESPHWFGRYVSPLPERVAAWAPFFESAPRPLVGIAWKGNPLHANDGARSLTPEQAADISRIASGATFVNLQFGDLPPAGASWIDPGPRLRDWDDTIAIIHHLDLVICVDTSVAHVAGAMEKPVRMLRAYAPEWRWPVESGATPWYPSMRLFRQHAPGDWTEAMAGAAAGLS